MFKRDVGSKLGLKYPVAYFGVATVILAIPTIIAQFYLISATGQLAERFKIGISGLEKSLKRF